MDGLDGAGRTRIGRHRRPPDAAADLQRGGPPRQALEPGGGRALEHGRADDGLLDDLPQDHR
eukprot:10783779-Alexandrium_andersonii.AAC.1